jgi:hypothetical protein
METKRLITAAVLAAAAAFPAARAEADVNAGNETAVDGPVSATISWDAGEGPRDMRLAITRNGVVGLDRAIPQICGESCSRYGNDAENFQIRDLDGDGETEVIVSMNSGEPCCYALGIFDYRPADGTYREFSRISEWSMNIADLNRDGRPDIKTSDARIAGGPVRIFDYERSDTGVRLDDVTRRFPAQIRDDARFAKTLFTTGKRPDVDEAEAYVSEYVADEYLLGQRTAGLAELDKQIKRGVLGKPRRAKAFRRSLLRKLDRYGYR